MIRRRRTGQGQWLDVSQSETAIQFLAPVVLDYTVNGREAERMGNACPFAAPHGAYPCKGEDRWCAISVFTDEEWRSFCHAIGDPEWTKRPDFATLMGKKEKELDELVSQWAMNCIEAYKALSFIWPKAETRFAFGQAP